MAARILIIEDDLFSRDLLKYLLEAAGYETLCAIDGEEGSFMALEQNPDLLLCDLQMPRLNGYQVAQRLLAHPRWRRVPMIAVTAFSMSGDREKALAAGFDDHVTKPINPKAFVVHVERFLPVELRARPGAGTSL